MTRRHGRAAVLARGFGHALLLLAAAAALWLFGAWCLRGAARAADDRVSVAIVLAADVSASINDDRFKLQRDGYADAVTDHRVLEAVRRTGHGRIALTYVEWSGAAQQRVVVPWTVIAGAADAEAFAARLHGATRSFSAQTAIGADPAVILAP